jgi:hypothetical protein
MRIILLCYPLLDFSNINNVMVQPEQVKNASELAFSIMRMGGTADYTGSPAGQCANELRLPHFLVNVIF